MDQIIETLSAELGRPAQQVENVVTLIDEGATIPFIARYRKELHGSMDDQLLRQLAERLQYLRNLEQRKGEIKTSIENQGKLTDELSAAIDAAKTLAEAEDLYRPYKQKRRTRATIAREKGLAPLAQLLFSQSRDCPAPEAAAADFIDPEKGVDSIEAALQGASDIIAEEISDDAAIRKELRSLFLRRGLVVSKAADKEPEDTVYRLYYDFKCPVSRIQGYQVLAINRGEREDVLKVSVELDAETAYVAVRRAVLVPGAPSMAFVRAAADDAYDGGALTFKAGREGSQYAYRAEEVIRGVVERGACPAAEERARLTALKAHGRASRKLYHARGDAHRRQYGDDERKDLYHAAHAEAGERRDDGAEERTAEHGIKPRYAVYERARSRRHYHEYAEHEKQRHAARDSSQHTVIPPDDELIESVCSRECGKAQQQYAENELDSERKPQPEQPFASV